jgi:hypothetical protein
MEIKIYAGGGGHKPPPQEGVKHMTHTRWTPEEEAHKAMERESQVLWACTRYEEGQILLAIEHRLFVLIDTMATEFDRPYEIIEELIKEAISGGI